MHCFEGWVFSYQHDFHFLIDVDSILRTSCSGGKVVSDDRHYPISLVCIFCMMLGEYSSFSGGFYILNGFSLCGCRMNSTINT